MAAIDFKLRGPPPNAPSSFDVRNEFEQGAYGVLDGRIELNLWDGQTMLAFWAKNLLDREYNDGTINLGEAAGADGIWQAWPRTYGMYSL